MYFTSQSSPPGLASKAHFMHRRCVTGLQPFLSSDQTGRFHLQVTDSKLSSTRAENGRCAASPPRGCPSRRPLPPLDRSPKDLRRIQHLSPALRCRALWERIVGYPDERREPLSSPVSCAALPFRSAPPRGPLRPSLPFPGPCANSP